ncbi:polysaccharide pyruvyl transferase family protein [Shimia abyssi]|uniref:Polysaccharide pyruvyl transferase WcaK-like protein n=1 Tax=Shimia abyssi TaxID=1662395 RepID=A0A2P8F9X1_9RHOB|nr:polysaccharide pyruvyl transferase family protein [Shimia abyssi]PSL18462.1 polysaccharide pyruvyl transferase WcaK-like protein [Shimia abyssi]
MKIVIFGLPYSENVGDGVIAECLSHTLEAAPAQPRVNCIDISGREGFGQVMVKNRQHVLRVLSALPLPVRQLLVKWKLGKLLDTHAPRWSQTLNGADLAIIGGGQILSDADLNFPLKVSRVARLLRGAGIPYALYAAGVASNWTKPGAALFHDVFSPDLFLIGLRDAGSIENWQSQCPGTSPLPLLRLDPGLLAFATYGAPSKHGDRIGLCITDPSILNYHADGQAAGTSGNGLDFYADIILTLIAQENPVSIFCNGAAEDRRTVETLATHPDLHPHKETGALRIESAPNTPRELVSLISGYRAVLAHRLHACIVAYSYQIPCVGFGWDNKLADFFKTVHLGDRVLTDPKISPADVLEKLNTALSQGINPDQHAQILAKTRDDIHALTTVPK